MTGTGPDYGDLPASYTGERRVTVDLDDCSGLDIIRSWSFLRDAGAERVECRVSSSGSGAHIRAWFRDGDVDAELVERLRFGAGDHDRRVELDRTHELKPKQILFSEKPGGSAGPWHDNPFDAVDELAVKTHPWGLG